MHTKHNTEYNTAGILNNTALQYQDGWIGCEEHEELTNEKRLHYQMTNQFMFDNAENIVDETEST